MGCIQSTSTKAKARNDEIENHLGMDRVEAANEIKIVIASASNSEKSKFLHQIKLSQHDGYTDLELAGYKKFIFSNTTQFMRTILKEMPQLDLTIAPHNDAHRALLLSLPAKIKGDFLPMDVAEALRSLWDDSAVREAVCHSCKFQLNDSAVYYFNSIGRMASSSYLPTDEDISHSQVMTTGIAETAFKVGELTYKIVDVGGQRGERKKWIHCFENVTALLFVVNLNEYDQTSYEDESANRMQDALTLFDSICNSKWMINTSIILFLNNTDLFAEKLPRSPLEEYFPEYKGGNDYESACRYLRQRFLNLYRIGAERQVYVHYTSSEDTKQMRLILEGCNNIRLQLELRASGLI